MDLFTAFKWKCLSVWLHEILKGSPIKYPSMHMVFTTCTNWGYSQYLFIMTPGIYLTVIFLEMLIPEANSFKKGDICFNKIQTLQTDIVLFTDRPPFELRSFNKVFRLFRRSHDMQNGCKNTDSHLTLHWKQQTCYVVFKMRHSPKTDTYSLLLTVCYWGTISHKGNKQSFINL